MEQDGKPDLIRRKGMKRHPNGAERALLFAVGGDYSPGATSQQHPLEQKRRRSTTIGSTATDIFELEMKKVGLLRQKRRCTVHKMEVIRGELEKKASTPEVAISFDRKRVSLNQIEAGEDALREETRRLQVDLNKTDAKLTTISAELSSLPSIKLECKRLRNSATFDDFVNDIFTSIREGDLDGLRVRVAAMQLDSTCAVNLTDLVEESSQLPLLHVALMCGQQHIVAFLVEQGGAALTTQSIETPDSCNITPFYIALMHGNLEAVHLILASLTNRADRAALINQTSGWANQTGAHPEELPLFGAITGCMGDVEKTSQLLECLVENGADMAKATVVGNTLLHFIIRYSAQKRYSNQVPYLKHFLADVLPRVAGLWWELELDMEPTQFGKRVCGSERENQLQAIKFLLGIANTERRTPITLAAQLESSLYATLVQWEDVMRFPDPRFGGRHFNRASTYDVTAIESLDQDGCCQSTSVMNIVAHNKMRLSSIGPEHKDILCTEPLQTIMKQKWRLYQWPFYIVGVAHLIHMITFTTMIFQYEMSNSTVHVSIATPMTTRSMDTGADADADADRNAGSHRDGAHVIHFLQFTPFLILPMIYLVSELHHILAVGSQQKCKPSSHGNGLYRILILLFSVLTCVWMLLHKLQIQSAQVLVTFVLLEGWIFLVFFLRGIILPFKNVQIGVFPSMVQRMFVNDVIPFLFLTLLVLIAFSTAFHAILIQTTYYAKKRTSYATTIYLMVKYLCGLPNPMDWDPKEHDVIPKVLLSFYGLITTVLLINMLIAAMNRSYELIRNANFSPLRRQRLSIMMLFEQRLPRFIRRLTLRNYTIMLNPRTGKYEQFLTVMDSHGFYK